MRKRRILSLLLAVAVAVTMLVAVPLTASAAETLTFTVDANTSITSGAEYYNEANTATVKTTAATTLDEGASFADYSFTKSIQIRIGGSKDPTNSSDELTVQDNATALEIDVKTPIKFTAYYLRQCDQDKANPKADSDGNIKGLFTAAAGKDLRMATPETGADPGIITVHNNDATGDGTGDGGSYGYVSQTWELDEGKNLLWSRGTTIKLYGFNIEVMDLGNPVFVEWGTSIEKNATDDKGGTYSTINISKEKGITESPVMFFNRTQSNLVTGKYAGEEGSFLRYNGMTGKIAKNSTGQKMGTGSYRYFSTIDPKLSKNLADGKAPESYDLKIVFWGNSTNTPHLKAVTIVDATSALSENTTVNNGNAIIPDNVDESSNTDYQDGLVQSSGSSDIKVVEYKDLKAPVAFGFDTQANVHYVAIKYNYPEAEAVLGAGAADSGEYTTAEGAKKGVIRFLQEFNGTEVTEYGFCIVKGGTGEIVEETRSANVKSTKNLTEMVDGGGFSSDVYGIEEGDRNSDDTYHAIAYVVVGGQTIWSTNVISKRVDWSKKITQYEETPIQ